MGSTGERLKCFVDLWWNELYKKLKHGMVYVEKRTLEGLHWSGSLPFLLDANTKGIRDLNEETKEPCDQSIKKAVFIVDEILNEHSGVLLTIRDIVQANQFEYCILVTVASHQTHLISRNHWQDNATTSHITGSPFFDKLEQNFLDWMGNHEKFHTDWDKCPESLKADVQTFVGCWHNLLSSLDAKEDCYCVGPLSSVIATRLANFTPAKHRRKTARNSLALIFMDRSVDLYEPLKCPTTPILDRLLFSLDRFPGHTTDRKVDLGEDFLPGTLFHSAHLHPQAASLFESCMECSLQECVVKCLEFLGSAVQEQGMEVPDSESSSIENFSAALDLISEHEDFQLEHAGLYEMCCAIRQMAYQDENKHRHQKWSRMVKRCRQSQFSLEKLQQMIKAEKLSVEEELLCLTVIFSTHSEKVNEHQVTEYIGWLSDRILAHDTDGTLPEYLWSKGQDKSHDELTTRDLAKQIFQKLRNYVRLRGLMELGKSGGYLTELVERLVDPTRPEINDLVCKTAGLGDVLRSGLGMFSNVMGGGSKASDASTIIIFVLGGMSAGEYASAQKVIRNSYKDQEIILASNGLISANDVMEEIFKWD